MIPELVKSAQEASNGTPYASLPSGIQHMGSIEVCGSYLCAAMANYSAEPTVTQQVIALYNLSDLTFHSYIDISATPTMTAAWPTILSTELLPCALITAAAARLRTCGTTKLRQEPAHDIHLRL